MQTADQIHAKITEMCAKAPETIHAEVDRLLKDGACDLEAAQDDFRLPKLLYVVALRYLAEQYTPLDHDRCARRALKNLEKF
jgi:hypothetical protein